MKSETFQISRSKLLSYIKREQIAFLFCDTPIIFTHPTTNCLTDEELDVDLCNEMQDFLFDAKEFKKTSRQEILDSKDMKYFHEFANWTVEKDLIISVDDGLMLCLPNYDNYHEVFEKIA